MLPAGHLPATSWVHYIPSSCNTQSSVPEDGQNNCPKHVELTGIINNPYCCVGCLYYLYQWCTVEQISHNEIYLLIKYIKSVLWRVAKRLSYIEEARCLKVISVVWLHILWGSCWCMYVALFGMKLLPNSATYIHQKDLIIYAVTPPK